MLSFKSLATFALIALGSAQRRKENHTLYLLHCNDTKKSWGSGDDYRDKLDIAIYLYGPQEYPQQKPWHWGSAYAISRTAMDQTWASPDMFTKSAPMNGGNQPAYGEWTVYLVLSIRVCIMSADEAVCVF